MTKIRHLGIPDSGIIASVGYDPASQTLAVIFKADANVRYDYAKVTSDDFVQLVTAPSIGSVFTTLIKKQPAAHPFRKVQIVPADTPAS
jgi:hypothetical protein